MTHTDDLTTSLGARGPAAFDELLKRERESVRITYIQQLFLPGPLQVEGYATEMIGRIRSLDPGDPELRERVDVRMRRASALAQRLQSEAAPYIEAVLDEAALRRVVGGPEVMRQQLGRLRDLPENVQLTIVPFRHGAYPGGAGPVEVHEDANDDVAVYFESPHEDTIVINDRAASDRCREIVASLRSSAVTGADARALLETISRDL